MTLPPRVLWIARLARVTAGATLGLIVAGGLVTNTGNALAVPDWPTTFGHHMLLYPWSGMVGGVLLEHGHRLLGVLVGGLTLVLAGATWLAERRRWVRGLAAAAVILVLVQGLVGGLRVVLLRETLAIVHGCLAQAFFALTVTLAVVSGRAWRADVAAVPDEPGLPRLSALVAAAVYGQAVLGAFATHAGWIWAHVAGAVLVTTVVTALAARVLGPAPRDPLLAWWGRALASLAGVQVALGTAAYLTRVAAAGAGTGVALPVLHRAAGACLLGAAVALALHAWRRRAGALAGAGPARSQLVGTELPA